MKHAFARQLRRNQTGVERKSWGALRNRRFAQFKFRRQQPIGPYVVDFVCFQKRFVIELDGSQHSTAADDKKETYLRKCGYRIKRYWSHELNEYFDTVLEDIYREMMGTNP